jgi:hypothetical protein
VLDAGDPVTSGVTDGTHAYFVTEGGYVVKILMSDMTFVSKIRLRDGIRRIGRAAIDTEASGGPIAYFAGSAAEGFDGQVVTLDLSGSTMVNGSSTMHPLISATRRLTRRLLASCAFTTPPKTHCF